ncbi:hypothetical protein KDL44_02675 [bacterium]|nr:hypothetical protein [bacterium]
MATKSVLSNVDVIRRFVFENQPANLDDIAAAVNAEMIHPVEIERARERYVLPVLRSQPYFRETKDGQWETINDKMPEYSVLEQVMREEQAQMYERDVRSRIARKLGWKVNTVVIDLEKAAGLVKQKSWWGMKDWVLCNDVAEEILRGHPNGMSEKDLMKAVVEKSKLAEDKVILNLKGDLKKRFGQDRKNWFLKELMKAKEEEKVKSSAVMAVPEKSEDIDSLLEGSFLDAQSAFKTEEKRSATELQTGKSRLKKALKKQAMEVLEQREDTARPEDLAARMNRMLQDAGIEEERFNSFQYLDSSARERGLSPREREEIQQFIDQLLEHETVAVGVNEDSIVNAPLSVKKINDILRIKYLNYTRDRVLIPNEFYRLLVTILKPGINDNTLHPACLEGNMTTEMLRWMMNRLENAAWALVDDGSNIEVVQADGQRFRLAQTEKSLIEKARDRFIVSQMDLIDHFINYRYTGIEADKVLALAARINCRVSGFDDTYIVSKDFFSELPEVFNQTANDDNDIPNRFDVILGNYIFAQDANLAANYLDQSIKLLNPGGRLGIFVEPELLVLLQQHGLLGEFLSGMAVTHYIRLPLIEGRHDVVLLVLSSLAYDGEKPGQIITAELADSKAAVSLAAALDRGEGEGTYFRRIEQLALGTLIGS